MQTFDLIVIGAGSGLNISSAAASKGMKVAVVEKGPMGGTCLNRGCIPSKIIIHSADVAETIKRSKSFGINSKLLSIDFKKITSRASNIVDKDARSIEEGINENKNTTLFKTEARFVADRTLKVGKTIIKGNKVIIAAGTRPSIPPIEGLKDVDYMTSTEALRLKKQPKTLTILGGGYIAAELAHFYGALGTKINIIQRNKCMVPGEDDEIKEKFTEIFKKKYNVLTGFNANEVRKKGKKFIVTAESNKKKKKLVSDQLLVATGRIPNTDILDVEKTKVKTNEKGYIKANDYLETTAKNIWALGDIVGKFLFKHSANLEGQYVYYNAILNKKLKINYDAMPHAIFSSPQVAGVGLREQDLKGKNATVGKYQYISTGMGIALQDNEGFCKIFADRKTRKILGCHIMGSEASTLIHEVIVAMRAGLEVDSIQRAVHIHPALSEVVQRAVNSIEW
jgi:dihydrolipoamide dehydrogenase|tara:strand:+ start:4856 stop:6211 length:1356 start_codon:yes stop_codon:yes gene_type:complete